MPANMELKGVKISELRDVRRDLLEQLFRVNQRIIMVELTALKTAKEQGLDQSEQWDEFRRKVEDQMGLSDLIIELLGYEPA